jgi:hypothetical protein
MDVNTSGGDSEHEKSKQKKRPDFPFPLSAASIMNDVE